ncbi:MAG: choice-of-anchor D domain-containing protein [Deltaproteobacteria bacterium]|nr:choice-of-anchor D domain-containing protein [Deltaproteobacteria bacterium]
MSTAHSHRREPAPRAPRLRALPPLAALVAIALGGVAACARNERAAPAGAETRAQAVAPVGQGFHLNASDLRFILQQIKIAENHAAGGQLLGPGPDQVGHPVLPFGLRTVDGTFNNLQPGQSGYGAADQVFPRVLPPSFRPAEGGTSYAQKGGVVVDSHPRLVSNLIVDQTVNNPAAVVAAGPVPDIDPTGIIFIPNVAPDVGLSAPYNSIFTLFGQFFDHGLDLVTKGGGTVFVPLRADDPLFAPGGPNFMMLTRATNQPGPDGVVGDDPATPQDESADDVQEATNTTTPFVDQNQTYTSHPSHQVFLRAYRLDAAGRPVATGKLIDGAIRGNIGNWAEVKAQARDLLGIALADADVLDVPLLATDPYGRFLRGPNGFPQVVFPGGVLEGNPAAPVAVAGAVRTGHAFLDDIAHHAAPVGDHDRNPATPPRPLLPDADPGTADDGDPATYDDELLGAHFVTGDGRGNENIGLTMIHTVFHSEHNRLADDIHGLIQTTLTPVEILEWDAVGPASGWDYGERLFQAARFVTEMEYQHLVFEEFARKVQPQVNVFAGYHTEIDPAIVAEFAHTVYRFGHSMLTETVARINADGRGNDLPLLAAFLNPLAFNDDGAGGTLTADLAAGSIARGMALQVGNELDEFVTEALRNRLLGLPLDLATINLARGRSEGIPTLNAARRGFHGMTGNSALAPYLSWADFALGIRHAESLVNFVAAYGTHPSIAAAGDVAARRAAAERIVRGDLADPATPADSLDFLLGTGVWFDPGDRTITGVDDVDFWVGGLAEKQAPFGGLLGSTFNFIFETQLERLQDGDRFYYLTRTAGLNLLVQLEGNSLAELIMRNTDAENLPADVFSRPDFTFNLAFLGTSGPIADDPGTPVDESAMPDLIRMPNGTVRYTGPAHVIWGGTDDPAVVDRIWSSEGDDTLRGNGGRDFLEGGAGNDNLIGGEGNDILTDSFGDDVLKGGDGNDVLSSGPGFDLNQGGRGSDFIIGGSDPTETFGGPGNDFIFAGDSADTVFGDDGDDWIEGGGQADLLQGDNGAPFQNDPNQPGHDVIIGGGGDDDYDAEGGDDIMVAGPGIERNEGMLGFDWVTHRGDPQAANDDMRFTGLLPPDVENVRDRFDLVEGLSGWNLGDVLRGDDRLDVDMVGHELTAEGVARIAGLGALLGGASSFTGGNIILGGGGSDVLEGRGGNDLIDGDAWLDVKLRAPDPASPGSFRLVDSMLALRADMLAGRIDPGDVTIVRSIVTTGASPSDVDTAVFTGLLAEYTITPNADGTLTVDHNGGVDGVDTLRNVEVLLFADGPVSAAFPVAGLSTAALTFATQVVGTSSAPQPVIVSNTGVGALALTGIVLAGASPADFTLSSGCGATLAPGASCTVTVAFAPTAPGARTAALLVASDDPRNPELGVALAGSSTAVLATPAALSFASALAVTSPAQVVVIANASATNLRINGVARAGANPGQFAHTTTCGPFPANLAPGASCTVSVTFTPTTVGDKSAVLNVNVPAPGVSQSVPLAGSIIAPVFTLAPAALAFDTPLGITSAAQAVTVANTGLAPLRITGVARGGTNPGQFAHVTTCGPFPANLAPGASCTVSVTFTPTTAGTKSALLTVSVAAPGVSQSVPLTGTITVPTFTVSPTALAFGSQLRGTVSAPQVIDVVNTGTAPLRITGVTRSGPNAGQFAHTTTCGPFPATLAAGASCTVSVTFRPAGAGARTAQLNVSVAAPATSRSVGLSGTSL